MLCPLCKGEFLNGAKTGKHYGAMLHTAMPVPAPAATEPCPFCRDSIDAEAIMSKIRGALLDQQAAAPSQAQPPALHMHPAAGGRAQFEVLHPGSNAMVRVRLKRGAAIKAEADAVVAVTTTVEVQAKLEAGGDGAPEKKLLTGESAFVPTVTVIGGAGEVLLAPSVPGGVEILELTGNDFLYLQKEKFVAGDASLTVATASQGIVKGILSGEEICIRRISGVGRLVVSSFGAIHKVTLAANEAMIMDNAHLVAWSGSASYRIMRAAKGFVNILASGEGVACKFTGPGDIYVQSANKAGFAGRIARFLPDGE